jgi:hypothetical protein
VSEPGFSQVFKPVTEPVSPLACWLGPLKWSAARSATLHDRFPHQVYQQLLKQLTSQPVSEPGFQQGFQAISK